MAIATCVLTCKSWFCMSRMTCLIIFSGSSALSIRSLRLARTKVETRSSNAIKHLGVLVVGRSSWVVGFRFPRACDADRDICGDAGGYPDSHVAGDGASGRAQRGSESDGQAE